jgi:hypothetical protein
VKLMGTCLVCHRDLQLDQLVEGPVVTGRCPWCGEVLAPGYTVLLPIAIRRAEDGGFELVSGLRMLTGNWARFRIKPESVLDPIEETLSLTPGDKDDAGARPWGRAVGAGSSERGGPKQNQNGGVSAGAGSAPDDPASEDADRTADAILRRAAQDVSSACEVLKAIAETERSFTWDERTSVEDSVARTTVPVGDLGGTGTLLHRARPKQAEIRAALRHLRAVLREAEEAVGDLGG